MLLTAAHSVGSNLNGDSSQAKVRYRTSRVRRVSHPMARNGTGTPLPSVRDNLYPLFAAILKSDDAGEGPNEKERVIIRMFPPPHLEPPPIPKGARNSDEPLLYLARFKPEWFRCVLPLSPPQPAGTLSNLQKKSQEDMKYSRA